MNRRHCYKRQVRKKKFEEALLHCHEEFRLLFHEKDTFQLDRYLDTGNIAEDTIFMTKSIDRYIQFVPSISISHCIHHSSSSDIDRAIETVPFDWTLIHPSLDPASGELYPDRAQRKRNQVSSLIQLIEIELNNQQLQQQQRQGRHCKMIITTENSTTDSNCIIDFGSGSGHLGLLLAYHHPEITIILVERKEYSVRVAKKRIEECNLTNTKIYCGDIRLIHDTFPHLHMILGISLHSCGLLTDYAIDMCIQNHCGFVLSPCCYAQISKPPPDELFVIQKENIGNIRCLQSLKNYDILGSISSGAEFTVSMEECVEDDFGFCIAKKSMRIIDMDRIIRCLNAVDDDDDNDNQDNHLSRGKYYCRLSSLRPLSCSPKNNVIIGRYVNSV